MLIVLRQGFRRYASGCFRQSSSSFIRSMSSAEPEVKGSTSTFKDDQMETNKDHQGNSVKRPINGSESEGPPAKIQKSENSSEVKSDEGTKRPRYPKKKVAMLLSYCGVGYQGMQINPRSKTIERDLLNALYKSGCVPEGANLGKINFQRCARTDKGVSAAGQVVSLKMLLLDNVVEKLNEHLPSVIRVMDVIRTTASFNSKDQCSYRTYMYLLPTFSFQDVGGLTTETFRITDEKMKEVNDLLSLYKGTHNFHNFTSGKLFDDMSANRYIMDFVCEKAFIDEGIEFAIMRVKGQSFMLHQIRKMIGLVIAIVRGYAPKTIIERAYGGEKLDIPRAPGLGLLLESVHYDWYNKKWSGDGVHEQLDWERSKERQEEFKRKHIYPNIIIREKYNSSMMHWLATLPLHSYDCIDKPNPMRRFLGDQKDEDGKKVVKNTDKFPHDVDLAEFKSSQTPEEFLKTLPPKPADEKIEEAVVTSTVPDKGSPQNDKNTKGENNSKEGMTTDVVSENTMVSSQGQEEGESISGEMKTDSALSVSSEAQSRVGAATDSTIDPAMEGGCSEGGLDERNLEDETKTGDREEKSGEVTT